MKVFNTDIFRYSNISAGRWGGQGEEDRNRRVRFANCRLYIYAHTHIRTTYARFGVYIFNVTVTYADGVYLRENLIGRFKRVGNKARRNLRAVDINCRG